MLKMVSNETDIDSNKIEFDITFRMRFILCERAVTGTCDYVNWRGLRACCVVLAVLVSSIQSSNKSNTAT